MPLPADELVRRAARVRFVIFDVDGVLTDGRLHYGPTGEISKTFHVRDGHGIVLLRLAGYALGVLSGRDSEIVRTRMRELGVRHLVQGSRDKSKGLDLLLAKAGCTAEETAYIGDDVNDLPALTRVGLAACPADACAEVLETAHFVAKNPGGLGAARELCDLLLSARTK